jgi:YidC/Oxa1 family membrane protein insertase
MDKRVFLAAAVSVVILLGWSYLFPPPQPQQLPEAPDSGVVEPEPFPSPETVVPVPDLETTEVAGAVQAAAVRELVVRSDLFEVTLTNRGAVATSWLLNDDTTGFEPLELLPAIAPQHALTLGVDLDDRALTQELNEALYQVERFSLPGERGLSRGERITFTWSDGHGLEARKELTFREGSYLVEVELDVTDRGRRQQARLVLGPGLGAQGSKKGGTRATYYYEAIVWNQGSHVTHRRKGKLDEVGSGLGGAVRWAGLEDQYFAALILPNDPDSRVRWWSTAELPLLANAENAPDPEPFPVLAVSVPPTGAYLFVGPKKYRLLEGLGSELEKVVWFSSFASLSWISRHIFFGLLWIYGHTIPNYGLAIILSTFLLRLLLFPVNQYSMVSMKKTQLQMQRLQPKIKSIKNKYKKSKDAESRAKMNKDMMEMYRVEGVNPMGGISGCLPMIAQIPILMAFYFMLTVAVELRGAPFFGWIHDLSVADPFYVTPILMGATMFAQQRMSMSKVKDPTQQQQQKIMMIMPFVFTWICIQMPAGMVLYWFANNLLGIGQQWLVNRHTTRLEAAAQKA